jgi:putative DNA primase/helicase
MVEGGQAWLATEGVGDEMKPGLPCKLISRRAADITPEPIEWLWPNRIAIGKLTLLAGEAGLGKSQVGISMAAAVTRGDA